MKHYPNSVSKALALLMALVMTLSLAVTSAFAVSYQDMNPKDDALLGTKFPVDATITLVTDENGKEYADNGERAIFFARGVLETVKKLRWQPDVIVCQGWASAVVPFYVKTAYSEEPSFAESKVITALYTNELKGELGTNFKRCVAFRDAKSELLDGYQDDFNFIELGKLAIDYSDGVVEGEEEANQILFDYAKEKNKPILAYPGEDIQEPYADFINKVCPDAE